MRAPGGEGRASVADRVFLVLDCCAGSGRPLSLVELEARTGLPKTTLHRICWKLVELGMLEHGRAGFRVGTTLFALGGMNPGLRKLRVVAMPHLHTLVASTGWATNLAVLAGGRALIVEEVYGGQSRAMPRMVGHRLPLHATAVGKALLSGYADDELDSLVEGSGLRPFTGATIVHPGRLRAQIEVVRRTGIAYSHEEWEAGTSGVAAPVLVGGGVAAAIAAVGPPGRAGLRQRADSVRVAAAKVARAFGPVVPYPARSSVTA